MTRRLWTIEDDYVLRRLHGNGRDAKWIARFMCCHKNTIHRRARALGIAFDGRHVWTPAEDAILRRRYPDEQASVIAHDLGFTLRAVYQRARKLRLRKSEAFKASDRSGRIQRGCTDPRMTATQFKKGLVPHNKGLRRPGFAPGRMAETQFKPGQLSGRARQVVQPIGAERVSKEGILQRKVNNDLPIQRRWKAVHAIVWEAAHGPIPRGHVVVFHDHDRRNFNLSNLELVSWAENMRRNTYHRYPQPIPQLIQLRGAFTRKINNRIRKHEKPDRGSAQSPVRRTRSAGG